MQIDFRTLPARDRYKLLVGVVVPRPIALVTTLDEQGVPNAAPFSFFNAMGSDPPLLVIGVGDRMPGNPKDTARNVAARGEFVVNVVAESIVEQMNVCATEFPHGVNELAMAGLTAAPSTAVAPPRIAESPVSMECRHVQTVQVGNTRILIGEVLVMHAHDGLVDPTNYHVRTADLHLVGRMESPSAYMRTNDRFELARLTPEQVLARKR